MLSHPYLILTFGNGPVLKDPCFLAYVKSATRVPDADVVVLTDDDLSEDALFDLEEQEVKVVKVKKLTNLFRDRHLAYWNYLNNFGHKYRYVIITDCRDVLFQTSPFDWVEEWKSRFDNLNGNKDFLNHFVILTYEGFKTSQSGFACIDNFEFQSNVPKEHIKEMKDQWVVNGGVSLGTYQALMNYHLLVWATMLKSNTHCTDQSAINYLMTILNEDATYSVSFPQRDWLCLTGEGVKEKSVSPYFEDRMLKNPAGKPYAILHQWDRLEDSLRQSLLSNLE
jgi:hypothetical protein